MYLNQLKKQKLNPKGKINKKHLLIGFILIAIIVVVLLMINLLSNDLYFESQQGFYFINNADELHIINEKQDNIIVKRNVESIQEVKKYGDIIYFLDGHTLYKYEDSLIEISDQVNSYKVSLNGERVLFTKEVTDPDLGDLYLFEKDLITRIDANVGLGRYIFGSNKDNIYYVSEITAEESLGILYLKNDKGAPKKIAEDVYEPILSLKKNTVYFVRNAFKPGNKFELYFVKDKRVTEVGRNIQHIISTAKDEALILIQEKNDRYALFYAEGPDVSLVDDEIQRVGLGSFDDITEPLIYKDVLNLYYQKNVDANYFLDEDSSKKIESDFENFWLSESKEHIVTLNGNELQLSKIKKNKLSDTVSLATNANLTALSYDGEAVIYEDEEGYFLMEDGSSKAIEGQKNFQFDESEKYLIYFNQMDAYAFKLSANEPVYLGEGIKESLIIDKYVYTFTSDQISQYKLGKFSSNKSIDKMIDWSTFDRNY